MVPPTFANDIFEIERIHLTRIRTGSHNLQIETGRFANPKIPRDLRFCICGDNIQTLRHVLLECTIVKHMDNYESFQNTFSSIDKIIEWPLFHDFLLAISKVLKIEL